MNLLKQLAGAGWSGLPKNASVHREFERWATRAPDAPALITESRVLSYRELNSRANRLAWFLRDQGVGPGSVVATCFPRSVEMVVAQLAVLKAGAAYLPLSPDFPAERIGFVLQDCGARLALTLSLHGAALAVGGVRVFCLDDNGILMSDNQAGRRTKPAGGRALACVIYTSGSTGRPKGALITHQGIVRLAAKQSYVTFSPGKCFLCLSSPAFDAVLFEVWAPLMTGGCCVIFEGRWPELSRLQTLIRAYGVGSLFLTTSLFNQIIDLHPEVLEGVSEVMVGGEALSVAHVRRARERLPRVKLINGYGPTECTTFACAGIIGSQNTWGCESVPVGRAIRHTECYIVDEAMQQVPVGVAGELLLGGPGLALGYLNQPELTAEKFIPDPWSRDRAARLYRTGDLFRWLPNGALEFVSRMDDQIKLNGFRIELGEIENAAQDCAGVAKAVAVLRGHSGDRRQLILFLSPHPGQTPEPERVRDALERRLLEHMVPANIVVVPCIPLTANGKTDRAALLRAWEEGQTTTIAPMVGERLEMLITDNWQRALQRSDIGVDADFFACGGDSLLAMQLALGLERELGRPVQVGTIFMHPTPASLVRYLQNDSTLCTLQGDGTGPPLFYVPELHGVGRLPPVLVQNLQGKRRYYEALQYPGMDGGTPCERVEMLAEAVAAQIGAVYPAGPFCLYGFSFGGLVAYETARLMTQRGRQVDVVVLGDIAPAVSHVPRGLFEQFAVRLWDAVEPPWDASPQKFLGLLRFLRDRFKRAGSPTTYPLVCRTAVARASHRAFEAYVPGSYAGRVTLVKCDQSKRSFFTRQPPDQDYGWNRFVEGPFTVCRFSGNHGQLFDDEACALIAGILERDSA